MKPIAHKLDELKGIQLHEKITYRYDDGRTRRDVERSINLIFKDNTKVKIICASSNSNADVLVKYNELVNYLGYPYLPVWKDKCY